MKASIEEIKNGLNERLKAMLSRAQSTKASARLYPLYQQLQLNRFMSEGASEGQAWPALNPEYADHKRKQYSEYPGAGSKMLIATSHLAGAVIGPGSPFNGVSQHRAMFTPYSMRIEVEMGGLNAAGKPFTYPVFVAAKRPFMKFSEASINKMKESLKKYLVGD